MRLHDTRFVVVDVETTGTNAETDQVVDIALIEVSKHQIRHLFSSLIKPTIAIPPEASAVHHITNKMVQIAPDHDVVMDTVRDYLKDAIAVSHNAAFDGQFVQHPMWLCTYRLARHLWPSADGHSNQYLRYWLGIDELHADAHRANGDAMVTAHILLAEMQEYLKSGRPDHHEAFLSYCYEPIRAYKMPFGKHKGLLMNEVPDDYLQWALRNMADLDKDLRWTMETILEGRRRGA